MKERRPKSLGLNALWLVLNPVGHDFGPAADRLAKFIEDYIQDDAFTFTLFPYNWIFPPKALILDIEAGPSAWITDELSAYGTEALSHAILLGEPDFGAWTRVFSSTRRAYPVLRGVLSPRDHDWVLALFDKRAGAAALDRAETEYPDWNARFETLAGIDTIALDESPGSAAFLKHFFALISQRPGEAIDGGALFEVH